MTSSIRTRAWTSIALLVVFPGTPVGVAPAECGRRLPAETSTQAGRSLNHDDPAIGAALGVLREAVNPVRVVGSDEIRRIYARGAAAPPPGLNAFRAPGDPTDATIYVNGDSLVYKDAARQRSIFASLRLAAVLMHEQVHNTDGDAAAYRLQSDFVRSRLQGLPRGQREHARRYADALDARARAFARVQARSLPLRDRAVALLYCDN